MYLKIQNGTKSKSYQLTNTYQKPYIVIKNNSVLPLTTNTTNGLHMKAKINNVTYRPLEYKSISESGSYSSIRMNSSGMSNVTGLTQRTTTSTRYGTKASTTATRYGTKVSTTATRYGTRVSTGDAVTYEESAYMICGKRCTFNHKFAVTNVYSVYSLISHKHLNNSNIECYANNNITCRCLSDGYYRISIAGKTCLLQHRGNTSTSALKTVYTSYYKTQVSTSATFYDTKVATTTTIYDTKVATTATIYDTKASTTAYAGYLSSSFSTENWI